MKVELRYTGTHRPKGMIVEVEESDSDRLISEDEFELVTKNEDLPITNEDDNNKPNMLWKELEIYNWIKDNKIPVKYSISNDTKVKILNKLKKGGFI